MGNKWRNHWEGDYYDHPSNRVTTRKGVLVNEIVQLKTQCEHCRATIRDIEYSLETVHVRLNELELIERT